MLLRERGNQAQSQGAREPLQHQLIVVGRAHTVRAEHANGNYYSVRRTTTSRIMLIHHPYYEGV